jgi:hypothetical protein
MEEEIARLRQQLEEERRRREEAEGWALDEQRQREEAEIRILEEQQRRQQAEDIAEASQPQTLQEYLEACHSLSLLIQVVTDKSLTTQGDTTKPAGRLFPRRIVPWDDFGRHQEQLWHRLLEGSSFHSERIFPSTHQLEYVRSLIVPITGEVPLRYQERYTVENAVQKLMDAVYEDETLRTKLDLKGSVTFESHTNLGQTNQSSITESMEQISTDEDNQDDFDRRTKRRRKERSASNNQQQIQSSGAKRGRRARGKGNRADEFCVYRTSDGDNIPTVAIEYKAPHKLSRDELVTGLDTEIQPERDVIHKEGDDFIFAAKSLSAAVITQLFSYMIGKGLQYGYVCQGEAFVFLHIPDDPTIVYYSVAVPNLDVQEDDENRLHFTAVAQVFAFVLNALLAKPPPQDWHHKADANLDTWDVEYIDILAKIPETVRKFHSPSPYKPQRWQGFNRTPIRTRSRCMPFHNDGSKETDDHDDNTPSATPSRSTGSNKTSATSKDLEKASSTKKRGQSAKGRQQAQVSKQTITTSPFCTQKCLLGLAHGATMDEKCPNFSDHGREHIGVARFLELIRAQLASNIGVDAGCQPLYLSGSRGSLFKIRLPSHGYTLVAKGVERIDHSLLQHEQQVYHRLSTIQGVHVPVCLGIVDLLRPYYYDCGVYTSLLFLGWAGKPLSGYINKSSQQHLQDKAMTAFRALHELHVLHRDAAIRNIVYDKPNDNLMIVDFERAKIQHRQPLQPITTNHRRKRKRASSKLEGCTNNDYEGEMGLIFQCFRRFG